MTAVRADEFRIAAAPREEANPVCPEETHEGMTDGPRRIAGLEKTMAAVAGIFDETIPG